MDDEDEIPCHFKVDNYAPAMWFVLSPNSNENQCNNRNNYNFEFCPLCQCRSRVFYCCDCICKGEFTHSNPRKPGVLSEKRLHFQVIERQKQELALKILQKHEVVSKEALLLEQIKLTKQRIRYLKAIMKEKGESVAKTNKEAEKLKVENTKRTVRLPQFESKVSKIEVYVRQHLASLEQQKLKVNQHFKALAMTRREHLNELSACIFPIELVDIQPQADNQCEPFDEIMAEMEDAISTSFIHGRWVTTSINHGATAIQLEGEKQWKIVAPLLPANDSLMYYSYVASSEASVSTDSLTSPLHAIMGGLSLTAQLLCQISSCIDLILPKRVSISDFSVNSPSNEFQFMKKLLRLNINALFLCLTQNLDLSLLRPTEALYNLSQFFESVKKNGTALKVTHFHLDLLHELCQELCKDLEKVKLDDFDMNYEEDFDQDLDPDWEAVGQQSNDAMMAPASPVLQYNALSSAAGSFMSSLMRGITSPANSPTSPHKWPEHK